MFESWPLKWPFIFLTILAISSAIRRNEGFKPQLKQIVSHLNKTAKKNYAFYNESVVAGQWMQNNNLNLTFHVHVKSNNSKVLSCVMSMEYPLNASGPDLIYKVVCFRENNTSTRNSSLLSEPDSVYLDNCNARTLISLLNMTFHRNQSDAVGVNSFSSLWPEAFVETFVVDIHSIKRSSFKRNVEVRSIPTNNSVVQNLTQQCLKTMRRDREVPPALVKVTYAGVRKGGPYYIDAMVVFNDTEEVCHFLIVNQTHRHPPKSASLCVKKIYKKVDKYSKLVKDLVNKTLHDMNNGTRRKFLLKAVKSAYRVYGFDETTYKVSVLVNNGSTSACQIYGFGKHGKEVVHVCNTTYNETNKLPLNDTKVQRFVKDAVRQIEIAGMDKVHLLKVLNASRSEFVDEYQYRIGIRIKGKVGNEKCRISIREAIATGKTKMAVQCGRPQQDGTTMVISTENPKVKRFVNKARDKLRVDGRRVHVSETINATREKVEGGYQYQMVINITFDGERKTCVVDVKEDGDTGEATLDINCTPRNDSRRIIRMPTTAGIVKDFVGKALVLIAKEKGTKVHLLKTTNATRQSVDDGRINFKISAHRREQVCNISVATGIDRVPKKKIGWHCKRCCKL